MRLAREQDRELRSYLAGDLDTEARTDLAAALRDAGLTLGGGGVFQQFAGQDRSAAQARGEADASRRSGRAATDSLADTLSTLPTHAAAVARPTRGVVDLYA